MKTCLKLLLVGATLLAEPFGARCQDDTDIRNSSAKNVASVEETSIHKVLQDQVAAWNKGDLAGFMAGYWNSKNLTYYSGKEKQQGWDEAFDRYKKRYQGEGKEMGKLAFSELDVQLLNSEFAVVKGRWLVEMKAEKLNGLFTLIVRKTDQGWLIVHDHTSM